MCRKSHYERTIKMTSPLSVIVLVIWTSTFCQSWPNNDNPPSMIGYIVDIYDQIKTIYKLTFKGNCSQTIYHFSFTRGQVERKKRLYTLRSTWIKPMIGLVQFQNACFVYNGLQLLTVMSKKHWGSFVYWLPVNLRCLVWIRLDYPSGEFGAKRPKIHKSLDLLLLAWEGIA